jgi:hypothetical protein
VIAGSIHFHPAEFINAVSAADFGGSNWTPAQRAVMLSAKRAFLSLPRDEQERLARIADNLLRRRVRGYGSLTAFEILTRLAQSQINGVQKSAVQEALVRLSEEGAENGVS